MPTKGKVDFKRGRDPQLNLTPVEAEGAAHERTATQTGVAHAVIIQLSGFRLSIKVNAMGEETSWEILCMHGFEAVHTLQSLEKERVRYATLKTKPHAVTFSGTGLLPGGFIARLTGVLVR